MKEPRNTLDSNQAIVQAEAARTKDPNATITAQIHRILDSYFWPPELQANTVYRRLHDDHDGDRQGWLTVTIGEDGDAWVTPIEPHANGLRFRMPLHGGGASQRVRTALVILAEAIRLDNKERPL